MNISSHCKYARILCKASLILIPLLLSINSMAAPPPPGNMMGGPMMNDENMREYMAESGYGYGYGGMMRGYGGMMGGGYGPMMGGMMGGGFGPMMGGMMGELYGLNLSKEQREKIRSLRHSMRKENFSLMSRMMDSWDKMAELYDTAKPDPDKIGKAFDEISKIRREMLVQHLKMRNRIYDLLTEEQRKELESSSFGFGPMRGFGHMRGYGHMGGMMQ